MCFYKDCVSQTVCMCVNKYLDTSPERGKFLIKERPVKVTLTFIIYKYDGKPLSRSKLTLFT